VSRLPALVVRRYSGAGVAAVIVAAGLCACGGGGGNPAPTVTVTQSSSPSSEPSANAAASGPPAMVAVTTAGALVTLNPATGVVAKTLVASGVMGDEISVSSGGQVYFAVQNGCTSKIEEIPAAGGTADVLALGSVPAISPDGTKLAYASQPSVGAGCFPANVSNVSTLYHLDIRTLSTGATVSLQAVAPAQYSGLPDAILHLSWAADSQHLAVSLDEVQDHEGMQVTLVDTAQARYYLGGVGVAPVPVTGRPNPQGSYLREGVYMPDGNLFVSRACCAGVPVDDISRLMWEVNTSGVLVHQVALGFANLDHTSLDVSPDGSWLLYLAGNDLYVSHGGATPSKLTTGLIAAAWS
jgi:WD40-like Beta Propeller Repeat